MDEEQLADIGISSDSVSANTDSGLSNQDILDSIGYTGDQAQVTEIANTALPGQEGYGWKYYSDGTAISPDGKYYYQGTEVWSPSGGGVLDKLGQGVSSALKAAFTKNGVTDWRAVAGAAGGLYGMYQASQNSNQQPKGYQGGIPKYEATRTRLDVAEQPDRRPGEYGRRYFSDVVYSPVTPATATTDTAKTADTTTADTAATDATKTADTQVQGYADGGLAGMYGPVVKSPYASELDPVQKYAAGGLANLAQGKYLRGQTDGMADKIPAQIGTEQKAKLSHGEFVIPADVVSHLGNGNSDAGAERLYEMMDRIRKARTGNSKQGKQINPNKFMPV